MKHLTITSVIFIFFLTSLTGAITLSNSTWTFGSSGLSEATLTTPSQGDGFDSRNMITLEQVGGSTDAMSGSISENDTLDFLTWADDVHSNGNFSITNWRADAITGKQAFNITFDLNNVSAASFDYSLDFAWEVGADSNTQIIETSDGDNIWEVSDTWLVSDDASTTSGDPSVYSSWAATPNSIANFAGNHGGDEVFLLTYDGTLAGGNSRSFSFIIGIESSSTEAILSAGEVVPEPSLYGLFSGMAALSLVGLRRRH